jgi:hypothetical protein
MEVNRINKLITDSSLQTVKHISFLCLCSHEKSLMFATFTILMHKHRLKVRVSLRGWMSMVVTQTANLEGHQTDSSILQNIIKHYFLLLTNECKM